MSRIKQAKILMTFVLLAGSALSFILDWSANHLLNPLWHPHARFHGALLLFTVAGVSFTGTWLLWRRSSEPDTAFKAALMIAISYWTPLFYIPFLLPSSTWWAGKPGAEPHIAGSIFYPNLAVAALFLLLAVVAYRISRNVHPTRVHPIDIGPQRLLKASPGLRARLQRLLKRPPCLRARLQSLP